MLKHLFLFSLIIFFISCENNVINSTEPTNQDCFAVEEYYNETVAPIMRFYKNK